MAYTVCKICTPNAAPCEPPGSPPTEFELCDKHKAQCKDCHLPYEEFALDALMQDCQWLEIHPESEGGRYGLLCANCIVKRASEKTKATGVIMVLITV